jgi:hypothetical protein
MSSPNPAQTPKELSNEEIAYHRAYAAVILRKYNEVREAPAAAASVNWEYGAQAAFTAAAGFSTLGMEAYAGLGKPITTPFSYSGKGGALAVLGGVATWGTFWCFIDHKDLPGEASYSVEVTPVHISAQFFRNGSLIGHYVGGGIGVVNPTAGGGLGQFSI